MKEKLIKEANEIIEAMEYFKSFIERIPDDKLDADPKFYMIEMDLKMFKNKFKKK
jgi:TolA-binding protein